MSHFVGLCFGDNWENDLEYYYEGLEVEPYEEDGQMITYNPNSKWDWYSIGGRWDGFLILKERDEEGEVIETNQALFNEIDWNYMFEHRFPPFCFVDTDGQWNEKGEMGWWGVTFDEKPDTTWEDIFKEYLKTVEDNCLVTVIDFHI